MIVGHRTWTVLASRRPSTLQTRICRPDIQSEGSLKEITSVKIPYNSPQGLAGFELAA
jgi:hypothetical protein